MTAIRYLRTSMLLAFSVCICTSCYTVSVDYRAYPPPCGLVATGCGLIVKGIVLTDGRPERDVMVTRTLVHGSYKTIDKAITDGNGKFQIRYITSCGPLAEANLIEYSMTFSKEGYAEALVQGRALSLREVRIEQPVAVHLERNEEREVREMVPLLKQNSEEKDR